MVLGRMACSKITFCRRASSVRDSDLFSIFALIGRTWSMVETRRHFGRDIRSRAERDTMITAWLMAFGFRSSMAGTGE